MSRPKIWGADGLMRSPSNDLEEGDLRIAVVEGSVRIDVYENGAWVQGGVPMARQTWRRAVVRWNNTAGVPRADEFLHVAVRPRSLIAVRLRAYVQLDANGAARWTLAGEGIEGRFRAMTFPAGANVTTRVSGGVLPSPLLTITGTAQQEVFVEADGVVGTTEEAGQLAFVFGAGPNGQALLRRGSFLETTEM